MACLVSAKIRKSDGTEEELPLEEAIELAEADVEDPEDWNEVSRTTEEIDVGGVKIDRIVTVTFEKPSGKQIRLNFEESFD